MIITIDGPTGTGKSTVAKRLAKALNCSHLDSGAIYRSLAWFFFKNEIPLDQIELLKNALKNFTFSIENGHFFVGGEDVTEWIRSEEISSAASFISKFSWIREKLLPIQRKLAQSGDLVAEGRDMGSVVFPDADVKVYLVADPNIRAKRRFEQLKDKHSEITLERVFNDLQKRDLQDTTRAISPLKPAADATIIDTSNLSVDEVIKKILKAIDETSMA